MNTSICSMLWCINFYKRSFAVCWNDTFFCLGLSFPWRRGSGDVIEWNAGRKRISRFSGCINKKTFENLNIKDAKWLKNLPEERWISSSCSYPVTRYATDRYIDTSRNAFTTIPTEVNTLWIPFRKRKYAKGHKKFEKINVSKTLQQNKSE